MRDLACERVWRGVDWSELGVAGAGHPGHAGPHGAGEGDSVDTGGDITLDITLDIILDITGIVL